jgi:hypothetical protein
MDTGASRSIADILTVFAQFSLLRSAGNGDKKMMFKIISMPRDLSGVEVLKNRKIGYMPTMIDQDFNQVGKYGILQDPSVYQAV